MYKIYINETPLFLRDIHEMDHTQQQSDTLIYARYPGHPKIIRNYVDMLEKSSRFEEIHLFAEDYPQLVKDFMNYFELIEAAGGVVFNPSGETLLIFRRGHWDLPKGKIDPGETIEAAAIREVQEETGLHEISLKEKLIDTYHTYRDKKEKRILKKTYWYVMSTQELDLEPQTEEDIEQAVWVKVPEFLKGEKKVYKNILDILNLIPVR